MQKVYIKTLIIAIVFILAIGVYFFINQQAKLEALRDERTKAIAKERAAKEKAVDSLKIVFEDQAEELQNELERLTDYSENLVKQIRYYEKRPDLDLDFITASSVIAGSEYRPD